MRTEAEEDLIKIAKMLGFNKPDAVRCAEIIIKIHEQHEQIRWLKERLDQAERKVPDMLVVKAAIALASGRMSYGHFDAARDVQQARDLIAELRKKGEA